MNTSVPKSKFRSRLIAGGVATALGASTIGFVAKWEGLETKSYRDIVGVWTVCYGETKGVGPGQKHTKAECDQKLVDRLVTDFEPGVVRCVGPDSAALAPDGLYLGMMSVSYNIGTGAFCRSTAAKRAAARDWRGACTALTWFNKAGGKTVRGLVNRRNEEFDICVSDLAGIPVKTLTRSRTGLSVTPEPKVIHPPAPPKPKSCFLWWCN